MAVDKIPRTQVHDGARLGTGDETIIVPNSGKRMVVVGFRMQVFDVTNEGQVSLIGRNLTKISGEVRVDSNGINYVQDRVRIVMGPGESIRLRNSTNGSVQWAVFLEEHASAPNDVSV